MMPRKILRYLVLLLCGLLTAKAQTVPGGMTYQGRLTDASNAPDPDGYSYTGVPLKSGAFSRILGSGCTENVSIPT